MKVEVHAIKGAAAGYSEYARRMGEQSTPVDACAWSNTHDGYPFGLPLAD